MKRMNLKNSVIILTGASSGIGRFLLMKLLDEGATVVAVSRHMTKDSIEHERLVKLDKDLSNQAAIDDVFKQTMAQFKTIDAFIANAGYAYYRKESNPDWESAKAIVNTNMMSVLYSAQKLKALKGDEPFNFMVTLSAVSYLSMPGYALYGMTKMGLRGFIESWRMELNKGQIAQAVYPVATKTAFFNRAEQSRKPWPVQEADHVAKVMLKGLKKDRRQIFPSKLFKFGFKLFPWGFKPYIAQERKAFLKMIDVRSYKGE